MSRKTGAVAAGVTVIILALALPLFAAGCGPQTPQAAVESFFESIESGNWNGYLGSILPDDVRRMSSEDETAREKEFGEADFTYRGLRFKTKYNKLNKNKATVSLVAGEVVGKNPSTGKSETTTVAEIKEMYGEVPEYETQKYKGRWYVDMKLASADRERESTL